MIRARDVDLRGKRVLIREDFNVPLKGGEVGDDTRLKAGIPTIRGAHDRGATVIIVSHLGRPREGEFDEAFSLEPVSRALSVLLETDVRFEREWIDGFDPPEHSVTLCENVRFLEGEKTNDDGLARRMAAPMKPSSTCLMKSATWNEFPNLSPKPRTRTTLLFFDAGLQSSRSIARSSPRCAPRRRSR